MASRIDASNGNSVAEAGPGRLLRRVLVDASGAYRRMTRRDLILVGKGGHPFRNSRHKARLSAEELEKDLCESLARLGTGYLDVFLLHRDDPKRFRRLRNL